MDKKPCTFIMPYYTDNFGITKQWLEESVNSIFRQDDDGWNLIIIDDNSKSTEAKSYLEELQRKNKNHVRVIFSHENNGAGQCRNVGIIEAEKLESSIILFNDADDLSHYNRVKVTRRVFGDKRDVGVVYSGFYPIDEFGREVELLELAPSIREILEALMEPPVGHNAWQRMATVTGYTNLTSATSVRIELAKKVFFPKYRVSEDYHTWLRYSAQGGFFYFTPEVPIKYRVLTSQQGSSSRGRHKNNFYSKKARIDTEGVKEAIKISISKGEINKNTGKEILTRFFVRLTETLCKEGMDNIAKETIRMALACSVQVAEEAIRQNDYLSSSGFFE